ncbi:protein of unassigned function [Methylobacterium oryzae CBMB20]|uniref:Protein of unassigned function n=1 Tax=Methylobacterium oryzae CBMB20 TaxID=693986 RepID=A0A089QEV1_9HYPH|nr:protein of unassigned function [Methylobacterium oryzae CBMB20]
MTCEAAGVTEVDEIIVDQQQVDTIQAVLSPGNCLRPVCYGRTSTGL